MLQMLPRLCPHFTKDINNNEDSQLGYLNSWISFPFYFKYFDILFNKYTPSLEFTTNSPPQFHTFTLLPVS